MGEKGPVWGRKGLSGGGEACVGEEGPEWGRRGLSGGGGA